jgi:hypothetical protein
MLRVETLNYRGPHGEMGLGTSRCKVYHGLLGGRGGGSLQGSKSHSLKYWLSQKEIILFLISFEKH